MEQRGDLPQELEDIPRPPKKAKREYNSTAMDITIMDSCCSKASPAPKGQGVETDQDVPTSHGTEAQQRPASSPEALQQLRESLKPKFESVDTDGGMPIVFELPNGEKLTYNTDIMSCSTKMLYEYVFYAGLVNQRFRIFSGPARRPIPCNHSKISEINFLSHLLFVVEYEEGDILEFLQTVEENEVGGYYIQVDTSGCGTLGFTYVSENQWRYKRAKGDCFDVSTLSNCQGQVQIKLGKTILTVEEKENKLMEPQFMESIPSTETNAYHQEFNYCGSPNSFYLHLQTKEEDTYYFTATRNVIIMSKSFKGRANFSLSNGRKFIEH